MNLPWQTRKQRRRLEARRDTRGHHEALKRAHVATHALMQAEMHG